MVAHPKNQGEIIMLSIIIISISIRRAVLTFYSYSSWLVEA